MKIKVFSSGSKGNCAIIESENVKILVDCGITYNKLIGHLETNKIKINDIAGILITHNHKDHISGLKTLIKKTNMKVFIPKEMFESLSEQIDESDCEFIEDGYRIIDIIVRIIKTSHDAPYSVGFIFENDNKSIVYITDTGYINRKYINILKNREVYVLESNHDEVMLMKGPYPRFLKERVISDSGHLSNTQTSEYLMKFIGNKTHSIYLAHLSETNNSPELALKTCRDILGNININIAYQSKETDYIEA